MKKVYFLVFAIFLFTSCSKCPNSCDDGLDCTNDYCSEDTGFTCSNEIIPECTCGNSVCEPEIDENKCTCGVDCGSCNGEANEYANWQCINDTCVSVVKPEFKIESTSLINTYYFSMYKFSIKLDYDAPINTKLSNLVVTIRMEDAPKDGKNFNINRIILKDERSKYINEIEVNKKINEIGNSITVTIPFNEYTFDEERNRLGGMSLMLDVYYDFDYFNGISSDKRRENYVLTFGPVTFFKADIGKIE
ncbi:MAG: hypothetical protein V1859_03385 [archaeon]